MNVAELEGGTEESEQEKNEGKSFQSQDLWEQFLVILALNTIYR